MHQAALTPKQATRYIGIDSDTDALKASRSTGMLWGVEAPIFIKAGKKKILYRMSDLDNFLQQFKRYSNNAQISTIY